MARPRTKACRCGAPREIRNQCRKCHAASQRKWIRSRGKGPGKFTLGMDLVPWEDVARRMGTTVVSVRGTYQRAMRKLCGDPKLRRELELLTFLAQAKKGKRGWMEP